MTDYLLNQNLLIILSAAAALLGLVYLQAMYKLLKKSGDTWRWALSLSALLFAGEVAVVMAVFSLDNLPASGYYLLFVFDVLLVLNVLCRRLSWKPRAAGLAAVTSTLLLLAASINNFYQFYPNLSDVLGSKYQPYASSSLTASNIHKFSGSTTLESALYPQPAAGGTIYTAAIPGIASGFAPRDAIVYVPPAYSSYQSPLIRFPVIILLAGTPGSPSDWLHGGGLQRTMDDFASRHRGIAPVVAVVDHTGAFSNDTECVDSGLGSIETYLTVDVPAYIKKHFEVAAAPANWGIGGYSEGGMCAAMLTLRHQNVYQHFLDMSGDTAPFLNDSTDTLHVLFNGSRTAQREHDIDWLLTHKPLARNITGQFFIGDDDRKELVDKMRHTYSLAVGKSVPASYQTVPHEGHNFKTWARGFKDSLPKLSYFVGATNCETICTQ